MRHPEVRIGVIGAGRTGRMHAQNLVRHVDGARVVALADPRWTEVQELAVGLGIPAALAEYQALLADPAIDAVAICSPTDTHARIIGEAAEAGKHIFCEKPIALDLAAIDQALAAVARAGVHLQIGFNRRFDPSFSRVHEMVVAGEIGQPHILRITSRDPAPPPIDYVRASGGLFLDMTIHDFDMARYLMGSEVVEIYATGGARVDPAIGQAGDIDTAVIILRFADGAMGTIDNIRQAVYGYDQRVEVLGSEGMLAARNNFPDSHVHWDTTGVHKSRPLYFFLERYAQSFVAEMQAFIESIQESHEPPVTGQDGRTAVVMAMAAQRSLWESSPVGVDTVV